MLSAEPSDEAFGGEEFEASGEGGSRVGWLPPDPRKISAEREAAQQSTSRVPKSTVVSIACSNTPRSGGGGQRREEIEDAKQQGRARSGMLACDPGGGWDRFAVGPVAVPSIRPPPSERTWQTYREFLCDFKLGARCLSVAHSGWPNHGWSECLPGRSSVRSTCVWSKV